MRRSLLLLLIFCIVYGVGIYQLKYRVAHLESKLGDVQRDLIAEKESIHILDAEMSYISRPEHIAKLSEKYLPLSPVKVNQIYQLADIMPGVAYSNWAKAGGNSRQAQMANNDVPVNNDVLQKDDIAQQPVSYEVQ